MSRRSRVFKHRFHPKNHLRELYIKADLAELVIEPHDEEYIDLSGMVLGGEVSDVIVNHEEEAGSLRISIVSSLGHRLFDIKVKLRIPIIDKLSLLTASLDTGDIRVDGLPIGKMYLYTANGDIIAGGVNGKEVKLESINGDLYIRGGDIKKLDISSTNGDVRIESHIEDSKLKANNINGEIRLLISEDSNVTIQATSINGIIKIYNKERFNKLNMEQRYLRGILGKGDSEILLNTVNGNIRIEILEAKTISK